MYRWIAAFLVLCLLTGCTISGPGISTETPSSVTDDTQETTVVPSSEAPATPTTSVVRLRNGGKRSYLSEAPIEMVPFDEIELVRPDTQEIYTGFDLLTAAVTEGASAEEILTEYFRLFDLVYEYNTMYIVSQLRYEADTTNMTHMTAYNEISAADLFIERKAEAFYVACAQSDQRHALEEAYFGEGFFDAYEQESITLGDDYVNLSADASTYISQYQLALQDPRITYNGRLQSVTQLLSSAQGDALDIYTQYYKEYNEKIGNIFIQLLNVRRQEAQMLGYDNYSEYAFAEIYGRDYTVEEAKVYLDAVETYLAPLYAKARNLGFGHSSYSMDEETIRSAVRQATTSMGGIFSDAYEFMEVYDLADLTVSDGKITGSYTTYIPGYETPYILIDAQGGSEDLMTLTHEFGHFLDYFATYQKDEDIETAETFSQAFEFLMLENTGDALTNRQREALLVDQIYGALSTIVYQAAYASFEMKIYDMEEPTLEDVNQAYYQVMKAFGLLSFNFYWGDYAKIDQWAWIDINHFFTHPCYVISYSVSADAATQIYEKELEEAGLGVQTYLALLERQEGQGLQELLENAGLHSPLDAERTRELAALFKELLYL